MVSKVRNVRLGVLSGVVATTIIWSKISLIFAKIFKPRFDKDSSISGKSLKSCDQIFPRIKIKLVVLTRLSGAKICCGGCGIAIVAVYRDKSRYLAFAVTY